MKREQVEQVLLKIGMRAGLCGFDYITDAILIICSENKTYISMYNLYNIVARKNYTSWMAVERGIRYAFSYVRNHSENRDAVEHYIGYDFCTNADSIKKLYRVLRIETANGEGGAAA